MIVEEIIWMGLHYIVNRSNNLVKEEEGGTQGRGQVGKKGDSIWSLLPQSTHFVVSLYWMHLSGKI